MLSSSRNFTPALALVFWRLPTKVISQNFVRLIRGAGEMLHAPVPKLADTVAFPLESPVVVPVMFWVPPSLDAAVSVMLLVTDPCAGKSKLPGRVTLLQTAMPPATASSTGPVYGDPFSVWLMDV